MSDDELLNRQDIAIVGLPMRVGQPVLMVPLTCLCREDNPPSMIAGVNVAATCPYCKKAYAIKSVGFQLGSAPLRVEVSQILLNGANES